MEHELLVLLLAAGAGLVCGFLNTAASSGSAVSLPILMMIGLDPATANATNRIPVLIAGAAATWTFHRKGAMPWRLGLIIAVPVTLGGLVGATLAALLPGRDMGLIITAAMLVALLLLFTKLKQVLANAQVREPRFGAREAALFFLIGGWVGFIVLDGATYMLLALTLVVGLPLAQANAVRAFTVVPNTIAAIIAFAAHGQMDWTLGAVMGVGSVAGGILGAKLSLAPGAGKWIFRLLVAVILMELVQLSIRYIGPL